MCNTIHNVVTSAPKSVNTGKFNNTKEVVETQPSLFDLVHDKHVPYHKTENSTKDGFVNYGMKPK